MTGRRGRVDLRANRLRELEEQWRIFADTADAGIAILQAGSFQFVNRRFVEMFGYGSPAEMLGRPLSCIVYQDDYDRVRQASLPEKGDGPATLRVAFRGLRKDGGRIPVEMSATPVMHGGEPATLGWYRGVTDRAVTEEALRRSEERFRTCFNLPLVGVAITSPDSRWIEANDRLCAMLGYEREELRRLKWPDVAPPGDRRKEMEDYRRVLAGDRQTTIDPKRLVRKDGQVIDALVSRACVREESGLPDFVLALVQDVSDHKRAEDRLRRSLAEKEELLKEIHHRVKNNLQIVSSLLYLQSRGITEAATLEALNESSNRIRSMALAHDALYRSFDMAHVDMTDYLSNLVGHLVHVYRRDDIGVDVKVDVARVSFPAELAVPCGLIVNELVSNAFRHAFQENRDNRVGISLAATGDGFTLSVSDNGIGLGRELDVTQSPSLGLQLVCVLVDQLEGTLGVTGDRGTTFTITFK